MIDAGVDIVVVASPTGLHHEHAKAALEAGAHVMCEKPVTIDPAEAWDLVETAKRLDRELDRLLRLELPADDAQAKPLMEDAGIGELEQIRSTCSPSTRELLSNTGAYPQRGARGGARAGDLDRPATVRRRLRPGAALPRARLRAVADRRCAESEAFALMSARARSRTPRSSCTTRSRSATRAAPSARCRAPPPTSAPTTTSTGSRCARSAPRARRSTSAERDWLWRDGGGTDLRPDLADDAGLYDCIGPPTRWSTSRSAG